jgi:thymidylate synthase ThyX
LFKWDAPEKAKSLLGSDDHDDLGYQVRDIAATHYDRVVKALIPWLLDRGVDKGTARKQARGAARGYLGNALYTELVFSASVAQWKRMIAQRCSAAADAEIRCVYIPCVEQLLNSCWASAFEGYKLIPSPDGIGKICIVE